MQFRKKQHKPLSPLARWISDYVLDQEITVTELARRSGLSAGALRSLIAYPERVPTIETCVRLAEVTGKPAEELIRIAGMDSPDDLEKLHPNRLDLIAIYDRLPTHLRVVLVDVARALSRVGGLEEERLP